MAYLTESKLAQRCRQPIQVMGVPAGSPAAVGAPSQGWATSAQGITRPQETMARRIEVFFMIVLLRF
jgi:hypothetical protein